MRARTAFLLAPPVAPLLFWASAVVLVSRLDGRAPAPIDWGAAWHSLYFILGFGVPFAYAVAGVIGVPTYHLLRRRGWRSGTSITLAGAGIGAVAGPLMPLFGGWHWSAVGMGAVLGLAPALVFALLTRRAGREQQRPPN